MAKALGSVTGKKVLSFVGSIREDGSHDALAPRELTVGKRRYRLVPIESEDRSEEPVSAAEFLTPRELQIVALVADGKVNKQVADVLRISEWTVSTHLRRIFAKLGVDTRAAMVSRCYSVITVKE